MEVEYVYDHNLKMPRELRIVPPDDRTTGAWREARQQKGPRRIYHQVVVKSGNAARFRMSAAGFGCFGFRSRVEASGCLPNTALKTHNPTEEPQKLAGEMAAFLERTAPVKLDA